MSRFSSYSRVVLASASMLLASAALADPVLNNNASLMTATHLSRTTRQDALPLWWNRGTDLEGGIRFGGDVPASPGFNSGMGAATMGGIELASLGFSMSEVDMALPTNGPSVVIGRSFNHRQGSDTSVAASNGLQGYNWFQSAMPEITLWTGGGSNADDVVYLVYGANRFMEFRRTALNATTFKGVNGTTGVVVYAAGNGSTTYDTYTITDQNGRSWVFWGGNTASNKANWQLWKKSDPQGLTVYAGDKTTHTTAVTNGYASGGGISTLYQEFGDASGTPSERRYLFTYTTVSSVDRLTQVSAQIKSSGSWASPSGLTEIGRVSYDYYTTATSGSGGASDYYGNGGDLKQVTIRTPLTDSGTGSGTDLSSGILDRRVKYYRYYDTYNASSGRLGHPHALKLVMGFEGCRRFDWDDNATLDDSFTGTTSSQETGDLKPYSDAYYEYEASSSTQRLASAFFNGECGCGGGSANGTYTFTSEANGAYSDNTSAYDTAWRVRTVVDQPDSTYQVRYFDELGQPLSTVVTTNTGGSTHWITGVERDSAGRVTTIHSPANMSTYTHNTLGAPDGTITYSTSAGLVSTLHRYDSSEPSYDGDLDGLVSGTSYKEGTSGTVAYLSKTLFSKRSASISSITLAKPFLDKTRAFHTASTGYTTAATYDETVYTFTWWHGTNTNSLYTTPKSVTTALPIVKSSAPDQNGDGTNTADTITYLRKDGRTAFSIAADGVWTAMRYNEMGLPVRTVRDADPNISGDFDTNYGPGDYSLSTSTNNGLAYPSAATYDSIGRTVTSIARPDGATPIKRTAEMYYSRLADGRLATLSTPRQDTPVATLTYYGPMSYSVSNHAGRSEFSCTLGVSSTTSTKPNWLDESQSDPIYALENASANLGGTNRVNIFAIGTTIYNTSGSKVSESRKYTSFAATSTWTGASGTNYDATEYSYDVMGRADRVKDPTATITRTVFDDLGRTVSTWVGTVDTNGWTGSSGNVGADNMTQLSLTEFDSGGVGNSHVTKRTAYVQGNSSTGIGDSATKRETTYLYDVRGRALVTIPPSVLPCTVTAYDLRSRPTATAVYVAGTTPTTSTDPAATGTQTGRTALTKTFYDSRGQVYKTQRFKIDQSDGSDDDSLESLTWRDSVGRVIKQGGTANNKTTYDHLGRVTHQYTLARNNDSSYTDADGVSGDIVLEQSDTVYDNTSDKTGLVMMTATIMRNYDDNSTTGALDTNADGDVYAYDQTGTPDVKGRIQITAFWYDELDRNKETVQYGTYNYADFDRQPSSSWLTVPARSSTALRTTTVYNDNGTVQAVQAPKVDGGSPIESRTLYDQALRKVAEVRNYKNGTPSSVTGDDDVYTRYTYSAGRMATVWVDFDGDNALDANDQVTTYFYGVVKAGDPPGKEALSGELASPQVSAIASNTLLWKVKYPDQTGSDPIADRCVYFAYDLQGAKTYQRDNNGTVLTYTYDDGGRQTVETATTLGSGIDGSVRRKETVYLARGLTSTLTQFDATTSGDETDQVLYLYDDWGNLTDFRQDYDDVVTNSSPNDRGVHYTYTKVDTTSPTAGARRSGIRRTSSGVYYGSGTSGSGTKKYEVTSTFTNGGSFPYDDDVGRVSYASRTYPTSTVDLVAYNYGGTGTEVLKYYLESSVRRAKAYPGTSGWDVGFDRFSRPYQSYWFNAGTYAISRVSYDDNSNISTVENGWVAPWSATYESDGLNRLKGLKFGELSGGTISGGNIVQQEDWQTSGTLKLDQVGNWVDYKRTREASTKDDWVGTTTSKINQYTTIPLKDGANDVNATYNAKGMPTKDDTKAGSDTGQLGYNYVYDAWDRLVLVKSNPVTPGTPATVQELRYNSLGHRIARRYDTASAGIPGGPDGVVDSNDPWDYFQFNERWQEVAFWEGAKTNPTEIMTYGQAGLDGYGGSSYIDDFVCRERDLTSNGSFDDRYYYLQNWRNDVVAIMNYDGEIKEKIIYDAYGRPSSFSPGDIYNGSANRPGGTLSSADTSAWSTGSVLWNKDIGNSANKAIPDGVVDTHDQTTISNLVTATYTGGWDLLGSTAVNNRKGYAGYEFDNVLQGAGASSNRPLYHVRRRVLAADTGKWLQKDPLGYHDGMDLYEYCQSDATDQINSSGTATQSASKMPDIDEVPLFPSEPPTSPRPIDELPRIIFECTYPQSQLLEEILLLPEFTDLWMRYLRCRDRFGANPHCRGADPVVRIKCGYGPDCGDETPVDTCSLSITICNVRTDRRNLRVLKQTLIHEFTHLVQKCEQGVRGIYVRYGLYEQCDDRICAELEAYVNENRFDPRRIRSRKAMCGQACGSVLASGCYSGPMAAQDCRNRCKRIAELCENGRFTIPQW